MSSPLTSKKTLAYWQQGVRLYIAIGIILFTVEGWWWAHTVYGGTSLFATWLEELFAWTALIMITAAISIGPFYSIWPHAPAKKQLYEARRLLGVGGAWFAALHVTIAYASLFKFANPFSLPTIYQTAFAIGFAAFLILLAMAFTSFDKAFTMLGAWWFRLHRLVYIAMTAILLHAFLIGAHATHWPALALFTVGTLVIFGMHAYGAIIRKQPTKWYVLGISVLGVVLLAIFSFGYRQNLGRETTGSSINSSVHPSDSTMHMQGGPDMQGMSQ